MQSYMIKISVGIAYEQNRPTGVASALRAQFGFWPKSALKMHCTKLFLRQKLLQITIHNWCKNVFDRPTGVASALIAQFVFFGKKCLNFFIRQVDTNQYLQLLCYMTFFYILHHYGVIAASQICSACRESIVLSYGTDFFFRTPVYGKIIFSFFTVPPSHNYILDHSKQLFFNDISSLNASFRLF